MSSHGALDLTGYLSYDDIHEDVYQRLYSDADFRADPRWDRLIGHWPGVPYLNQFYRPGWQTRRKNTLTYVKADWSVSELLSLSAGVYRHRNWGRGDWLPPYIVDVVDDGGGPESELAGNPPVRGGTQLGVIRFVDSNGVAVGPVPGCTSSYIFNYYGSGGPEVDPACHPGASAVQSYRHSHYGKNRLGANIDGEWSALFGAGRGSVLRAGIWYEDSKRDLGRDWHRILDPAINFKWDYQAYWHQYEWDFPQSVFKWYAEETLYFGSFELTAGVKQYLISVSREDEFGVDRPLDVDSDSDLLISGGVTWETPVEGLDVFVGYAENFRAIGSNLLEVPGRSLDRLEPETASNVDVGVQYAGERVALSATAVFHRLRQPDLLPRVRRRPPAPTTSSPERGAYFNAGGIETSGIELATTVALSGRTSLYTALTLNDSKYAGTDDPLVDASQGIVPGTDVAGVPPRLVGRLPRPRRTPGRRPVREVHGSAPRQPDGRLVHRRLLDRGRLRHLPGRGAERPVPVDGVLDRREQPARHPLSVRDHRERRLARRAPHHIHDHDHLVLRQPLHVSGYSQARSSVPLLPPPRPPLRPGQECRRATAADFRAPRVVELQQVQFPSDSRQHGIDHVRVRQRVDHEMGKDRDQAGNERPTHAHHGFQAFGGRYRGRLPDRRTNRDPRFGRKLPHELSGRP